MSATEPRPGEGRQLGELKALIHEMCQETGDMSPYQEMHSALRRVRYGFWQHPMYAGAIVSLFLIIRLVVGSFIDRWVGPTLFISVAVALTITVLIRFIVPHLRSGRSGRQQEQMIVEQTAHSVAQQLRAHDPKSALLQAWTVEQ